MARPDRGMFSIKLIHPRHLDYPYFTEDFDGTDGCHPLMNFSGDGNGPSIAANIPVGHRALVYVIEHGKFIWAIEYVGTVEQGSRAAIAHGIAQDEFTSKWSVYLPIRFLAKVDLKSAPRADDVCRDAKVTFTPNRFTMKYITAQEYQAIFDAMTWQ